MKEKKWKIGVAETLALSILFSSFWWGMSGREISGVIASLSATAVIVSAVASGYVLTYAKERRWILALSFTPVLVVSNAFIWRFYVPHESIELLVKSFLISLCEIFASHMYFRMMPKPKKEISEN